MRDMDLKILAELSKILPDNSNALGSTNRTATKVATTNVRRTKK